jgi:hypothetical protein
MKKSRLGLIAALCFAITGAAFGQASDGDSNREKRELYPALEVQRPFLIPRGSFEIRSEFSYLSTVRGFDDKSGNYRLPKDWTVFNADLKVGYGVFKWWEFGAGIPYLSGQEIYAKDQSIGDLYLFNNFRLYQSKTKDKEIAATFRVSLPTGESDRIMTIIDGEYFPQDIRTGDPSFDLYPGVLARWSYRNLALRANAEYGFRLSGKVKTGIEALERSATLDPGESLSAGADLLYQIHSKFVILAGISYFMQDANKLDGKGLGDAEYFLGFLPGLEFQPTPDFDVILKTSVPIAGKNYPNGYPIILGINARF